MIEPFKSKSVTRLKKMAGQINGIMKMIEEDKYCIDVLTQLLALQGALKSTSLLILENHLNTCGIEHMASKSSEKQQRFIKEMLKVCSLSSR